MRLLLSGDNEAFGELWEYYLGKVFASVAARFPKIHYDDLKEISQDTWLKIFQQIVGYPFTTPQAFQALILKVAFRTAVNRYRKKVRQKEISLQDAEAIIPGIGFTKSILGKVIAVRGVATGGGSSRQEQEIIMWILLDQCLERISEQDKALIELLMGGMTPQQIANAENITVDAVYQRKRRALAALRAEYDKV